VGLTLVICADSLPGRHVHRVLEHFQGRPGGRAVGIVGLLGIMR